jgi:hypothetical protein
MSATPSTVVLAYFRVRGYVPVPVAVLADICEHAFPHTYGSTEANRARGLTCRTWVTRVLQGLREAGYLRRESTAEDGCLECAGRQEADADLPEEEMIERAVTRRSKQCDADYATAFLWSRYYETLVTTI